MDIEAIWHIQPDKIDVIGAAIDLKMFVRQPDSVVDDIKKKYAVPANYILYVGGIDARKNVSTMIRAFKLFNEKRKEIKLVLAGRIDNQKEYPSLLELIRDQGLQDKIVCAGFVSDSDLPGLYSGALFTIMPSLYEGFGLTIIESLACGTPVIASKNSSIPEAAGDCAIYCDVENHKSLAESMVALADSHEDRGQFLSTGPARAKLFNWDMVAQKMARGIKKSLEQPN